jgi:hypothetical protein
LYEQVTAQVEAHPRYQRPEFRGNQSRMEGIIYDRWMDALQAEVEKKPAPTAPRTSNNSVAARVSGTSSSPSASGAPQRHMSPREKLDSGAYGNLATEMDRILGH